MNPVDFKRPITLEVSILEAAILAALLEAQIEAIPNGFRRIAYSSLVSKLEKAVRDAQTVRGE